MIGLPIGGIAIIFERIPDLLERGLPLQFLVALAIISLLLVSLATVLLSRLLAPLFKTYLQSDEATEPKKTKLSARVPAQIPAPGSAVSSVTEGTTRAFEPLQNERDTQR
jgi:hypothetical protein